MVIPSLSQNLHLTGGWRKQPLEDFDGGRLSGAVWAQQAEAFARQDFQVESQHRLDLTLVGLAQVVTANRQVHIPHHSELRPLLLPTSRSGDGYSVDGVWML